MIAHGALLGRFRALDDGSAVAALPLVLADAHPDLAGLDILRELAVAFLVMCLDLRDLAELEGDVGEALGLGLVSHALVHVGPLLMLARCGGEEILRRRADARKELEPHLGVFLLVQRRLLKDGRDLLVALFLRLRGEVVVLVTRLALARKRGHEVGFCLRSFEFHFSFSFLVDYQKHLNSRCPPTFSSGICRRRR